MMISVFFTNENFVHFGRRQCQHISKASEFNMEINSSQSIEINSNKEVSKPNLPPKKTQTSMMELSKERKTVLVNILAGGMGGSLAAVFTCPLDVIQTRLQSSAFRMQRLTELGLDKATTKASTAVKPRVYFKGICSYARYMVRSEGLSSLFKGLGPTIVAVTPSRAIYFTTYQHVKKIIGQRKSVSQDSDIVHFISGAAAQFTNSTLTNPLWFLKTRLQLEFGRHSSELKVIDIIKATYRTGGIKVFYSGLSASYLGMVEVGLQFTFYEKFKKALRELNKLNGIFTPLECIVAAGGAKIISMTMCYPYEVCRTRLRQQESIILGKQRYRTCYQTLKTVIKEEGWNGLYGGLETNLIRQIPFTIIMFCTYEGVVYLLRNINV